jgi:hypothetical protein
MTLVEAARHMRCSTKELRQNEAVLRKGCIPFAATVEPSPHPYEVWRIAAPGVSLIVYPHRTSAHNHHLRVRNNGSKDAAKARALLLAIDDVAGYNCTFHCKSFPKETT